MKKNLILISIISLIVISCKSSYTKIGDKNAKTNAPTIPEIQAKRFITENSLINKSGSFSEADIAFTPLVSRPTLVKPEIKLMAALKRPIIPTPVGPIHKAINFDLSSEIKIFKNCTPPKIEVDFIIWRYED